MSPGASWGLLELSWGSLGSSTVLPKYSQAGTLKLGRFLLELSWGSLGSSKVFPKVSQAGTLRFDEFLKKEVQIRRTVALRTTLGANSLGKVEGKVTVYRPA